FITTPIERVIASADGIDYLESSSAQGASTITVHLKLNYDTNAALTQIQAKVAQVRNNLPPEAEAPVIELETADNQFAAMYLGFSSVDLDQNQITDYLMRAVQPKLSAIAGVQRADILGDRTFAMRIWLKPERMAAMGISPSQVRDALAKNNYLSTLGQTKGSMVSVNLVANTNLQNADQFRRLVVKESNGSVVRIGDIADVVMVENVERDLREGLSPFQAAIQAARELVGPIIAMTLTLAAVYTPVAIQGGLTGTLFREFAFTLAGAVIVSGIVALTLSPMMGSKLLRAGDSERGFAGWINRRFESVRRMYTRTLTSTLNYRPVVLVLWFIVAALMVPFY